VKISFFTKNIKLTTALKKYVEKKLNKIEKRSRNAIEAWVELDNDLSQQSGMKKYRAEIQIKLREGSLRAEEEADDILVAINSLIPKLTKQLERFKTRFHKA